MALPGGVLALALMLLLLAACDRRRQAALDAQPAATASIRTAERIAWIEGGREEALATARRSGRPLLVYWSAAWCPYCQQVEATVFTRADFIARSRQFVPVHLDGDDPGAQKWGEALHVQGYPTLLVLDPGGREIQRIAGGMSLARYAAVLDLALADLQPVDALLARLRANEDLPEGACQRLAWNAWELETLDEAGLAVRAQDLDRAARHCTQRAAPDAARLRVFAAWLQATAEADALAAGKPPSAALVARIDDVRAVLYLHRHDPGLMDALMALDANFFTAAARGGTEQNVLRDAYSEAMQAAAHEPGLVVAAQLGAIAHQITAVRLLTPAGVVPAALAAAAQERVESELARATTPGIRSGIFNAAVNIYTALGDDQRAYDVALAELGTSKEPYYVKADLGEIAERLGRGDEALKWWAEAYAEAQGAATRFQWGQNYASVLMRLAPQDEARIREVTLRVIAELDGPDRIYRRVRLRLEHLGKDLLRWNAAAGGRHAPVLEALRTRMQQVCARIPPTEAAHASCAAFLTPGFAHMAMSRAGFQ